MRIRINMTEAFSEPMLWSQTSYAPVIGRSDIQHQAQGSGEAELEADIPQDVWVGGGHDDGRCKLPGRGEGRPAHRGGRR